MKKRWIAVTLVLCTIFSINAVAVAQTENERQARFQTEAETLRSLTLFLGSDKGFELSRKPTRVEAGVMLIRVLGKEAEAKRQTAGHPFTDVPAWANAYVSYLWQNDLTRGISETKFGSNDACDAKMYVTFLLRALGYSEEEGDFVYDDCLSYAYLVGLFEGEYFLDLQHSDFWRDDVAHLSYQILFVQTKGSTKTLLEKLIEEEAVPIDLAANMAGAIRADDLIYESYLFEAVTLGTYGTKRTTNIAISMDGYPPEIVTIENTMKLTEMKTEKPVFYMEENVTSSWEHIRSTAYLIDDFLYSWNSKTNESIKRAMTLDELFGNDEEDEGPVETPVFEEYSGVFIEERDGKTIITRTLERPVYEEEVLYVLSYLFSDKEIGAIPAYVVRKAKEVTTIGAEGYLETDDLDLTFDFRPQGATSPFTIVIKKTTDYLGQGKQLTIPLPNFSGYKER